MSAPPDAAADGPATDPPQVPGRPPKTGHRLHRDSAVIGLLTLLLGFAIAVQVRNNSLRGLVGQRPLR